MRKKNKEQFINEKSYDICNDRFITEIHAYSDGILDETHQKFDRWKDFLMKCPSESIRKTIKNSMVKKTIELAGKLVKNG